MMAEDGCAGRREMDAEKQAELGRGWKGKDVTLVKY